MNDNQNPQFTDDAPEPEMSLKDALQRLADQLNETPRRKVSLSFLNSWFFGNRDVLGALLNLVFFGFPIFFMALGKILGYDPYEPSELWWIIICIVFGVLGLALFTPYWNAFFLFKSGYFTLGYLTDGELAYRDRSGNKRYWVPTRFYRIGQPFMDYIHRPDEPYLVVIGKNPYNIIIFDAVPDPEKGDSISFRIFMGLYAIFVSYNLQTKTFFSESAGLWRWIIPVIILLWTILWFCVVFFPAN